MSMNHVDVASPQSVMKLRDPSGINQFAPATAEDQHFNFDACPSQTFNLRLDKRTEGRILGSWVHGRHNEYFHLTTSIEYENVEGSMGLIKKPRIVPSANSTRCTIPNKAR